MRLWEKEEYQLKLVLRGREAELWERRIPVKAGVTGWWKLVLWERGVKTELWGRESDVDRESGKVAKRERATPILAAVKNIVLTSLFKGR